MTQEAANVSAAPAHLSEAQTAAYLFRLDSLAAGVARRAEAVQQSLANNATSQWYAERDAAYVTHTPIAPSRLQTIGEFLKEHPGQDHCTVELMQAMAAADHQFYR